MQTINLIKKQLSIRQVGIIGQDQMNHAAVILPLIEVNGKLSILFEVRSFHLRSQPGDICFPGGKIDEQDSTPKDAAIREFIEELQIETNDFQLLTGLDILVTPFKGIIYPYVAELTCDFNDIKANLLEVDHLFTVPLEHFINHPPEEHPMHFIIEPESIERYEQIRQKRHTIHQYFYHYEDYTIWGLTARILNHFINLLLNYKIL
ncbi:CoA pyrophosphatase [Bacillus sp. JCM 19034]|uniref:NUDIX hydrolase n=1 Tax=Bacillus sp. JCM 19034 TaxID=1481928 RepID=UPI000784FB42|nr:CoA pyrophosphatase [Bacillus sp. JCM 19034]